MFERFKFILDEQFAKKNVKFFKTLDVNAKKMIKGFVEKDKKGFFDWIFKR